MAVIRASLNDVRFSSPVPTRYPSARHVPLGVGPTLPCRGTELDMLRNYAPNSCLEAIPPVRPNL